MYDVSVPLYMHPDHIPPYAFLKDANIDHDQTDIAIQPYGYMALMWVSNKKAIKKEARW